MAALSAVPDPPGVRNAISVCTIATQLKTMMVRVGVAYRLLTLLNQRGTNRKRLIEEVRREALTTPELAEMKTMTPPISAVSGAATIPITGMWPAIRATGSPLWPKKPLCGPWPSGNIPAARIENAIAKRRTERMRPIDVRGMMVAGRRVSCATCEMDSRPTNEMMASEEPSANCPRLAGEWGEF